MRKFPVAVLLILSFVSICCRGESQTNLPVGVAVPLPPFTNNNEVSIVQAWRQSGVELMRLKNVYDGDANSRYSQWIAPTAIVVNATAYNVSTGICNSFSASCVDTSSIPFSVNGFLIEKENEKEARIAAFAEIAGSSSFTPDIVAMRYLINHFGEDLMGITSTEPQSGDDEIYQSKNVYVRINAPTNAVDFAVAIINAGLPENERIVLP